MLSEVVIGKNFTIVSIHERSQQKEYIVRTGFVHSENWNRAEICMNNMKWRTQNLWNCTHSNSDRSRYAWVLLKCPLWMMRILQSKSWKYFTVWYRFLPCSLLASCLFSFILLGNALKLTFGPSTIRSYFILCFLHCSMNRMNFFTSRGLLFWWTTTLWRAKSRNTLIRVANDPSVYTIMEKMII